MVGSKELGCKKWGKNARPTSFDGGLDRCCKVWCEDGLRRHSLLDGVFLEGWYVEVVLGKWFASMRCSEMVFSSGPTV